jgi:bifunctional NMN adenylyltransferase/nudix hydrolase
MSVDIKKEVDHKQYQIGVIMARFQVSELHEGQTNFVDRVFANHKKVIIFLGVAQIQGNRSNPLDFATRKSMIQERYPDAVILPHKDQRSDALWSKKLDEEIALPFGDLTVLLYGSRDSFIPHYKGKHKAVELETDIPSSGTESRKAVSETIIPTSDFRAGVIHAVYAQRPVTYPTVDVVAINDAGLILLGRKPNEDRFRFIGGFVDRTDENWEAAAKREFIEETGGCEIGDLKYVASTQVKDWRYAKTESGIMTTLFLGKFMWGKTTATDDIEDLQWVYPSKINVEKEIMVEHQELFGKLLIYLNLKPASTESIITVTG